MHIYSTDTLVNKMMCSFDINASHGKAALAMPELKSGGETYMPPLLTTWGDMGPGLVAVVYYHATYLFVYNCSHVVIMSVHDYVLIADLFCGSSARIITCSYRCRTLVFIVYAYGHVGSR